MVHSGVSKYVSKYSYLVFIILLLSCREKAVLFQKISSGHSNIHFNNQIIESDSINQLDIENVYNGGGVGTGDFNNDGLPDIFFTGNLVRSGLYLNKGDFAFTDITEASGIDTRGKWCRGVAVTDINNDGWQDIYICVTLREKPSQRINMLYVNQGVNENGIPVFREQAAEYGLADDSHSTQAVFFDYDNDNDLDAYIVINEISDRISPYLFHPVMKNGRNPSTGKLLRNDWSDSLKHPVFTDVSKDAGIQTEGYGHAASITDFNNDGWKDIYVSNDFFSNDLLWINNHDGTFTDRIVSCFKHTSANSMGNDVGDINNDGLQDVITLDMNPEDNYRKKMMLNPNSYQLYQNIERYGYSYQYVRNTLQLNQGRRPADSDSTGLPVFSEIGYFAGITETDWSWDPVLADFDNDGFRDLIICNGFPRDITDHDFAMFRDKAYKVATESEILMQIPEVKLHNYAFHNNGDLTFSNVTAKWGMDAPSFSNGAAYADLDRDGDLDLVISNINDEASLYRNNAREINGDGSHFLRVSFKGNENNLNGFGTIAWIYYDNGKKQVWENNPYRGYISTIENIAHFGLGKTDRIDSLVIRWQEGRQQTILNPEADQLLVADIADAVSHTYFPSDTADQLFTDVTARVKISFTQKETDFVDFNIQKLLPHKFSEYGPALAAGDIDGNGYDDIVCGGSSGNSAQLFFQQEDGTFRSEPLLSGTALTSKTRDDTGILLFDADNDHDPDLYIASGGYENESKDPSYRDHLYINNGKGKFTEDDKAIPADYGSKFCVRAADFDRDGDLDLFIAGRVDPWRWPKPVSSILLRNDSGKGITKFTDVTNDVAPGLINAGLVCDALFTDFDSDGWTDLILAGEWMPVTMLRNDNGRFRNVSDITGMSGKKGWWNSIVPGDFDNDGDIDCIIGNLGLNSFYKADQQHPVSVYASDFDNNGSFDAFPSIYLPASQTDTSLKEFPVHTRDDAVKQMISLRTKFQNYKSYAVATIDQLFSEAQLKNCLIVRADFFESSFCRNDGDGHFTLVPLPADAQLAALNGMVSDDFDGDGNLDVAINGNDWGTEVSVGRYDALNGLVLKGDGKSNFKSLSMRQSGIFIPGNGKALVKLRSSNGSYLLAAAQNRGPLKIYELKRKINTIPVLPDDVKAETTLTNGATRKSELYYGSSFLSQSSRFINADENMKSLKLINNKGKERIIDLK